MRFLLDTHTFAWAVGDPDRLGAIARVHLSDPKNTLLVSAVCIWEMSIKHHLGKWPEVAPFLDEELYQGFLAQLGAQELPMRASHARLAGQFAVDHRDPFDRMLAAQALLEGVTLISQDPAFKVFPIACEW